MMSMTTHNNRAETIPTMVQSMCFIFIALLQRELRCVAVGEYHDPNPKTDTSADKNTNKNTHAKTDHTTFLPWHLGQGPIL